MTEFIQEATLQILGAIVTVVVSAIGYYGTQFLRNNVFLQNLSKKKEITAIIVKFVEQSYSDIDGEAKLEKAKDEVVKWAKNIGLNITEQELDTMIESAVKDLSLASKKAQIMPQIVTAPMNFTDISDEIDKHIDSTQMPIK